MGYPKNAKELQIDVESAEACHRLLRRPITDEVDSSNLSDEINLKLDDSPARDPRELAEDRKCGQQEVRCWMSRWLWWPLLGILITLSLLLLLKRPGIVKSKGMVVLSDSYVITGPGSDRMKNVKDFQRHFEWTLSEEFYKPVNRTVVTVNHQFPGPLIEVMQGDTFHVKVTNKMPVATTIHWHGITQVDNSQDGVAGVTQNPILPGETFEYHIVIVDDPGTYWWHAHDMSRLDGLFGALVIHSRVAPTFQKSDGRADEGDVVVMTGDWYDQQPRTYLDAYLNSNDLVSGEPQPDRLLINGNAPDLQVKTSYLIPSSGASRRRYWTVRLINVGALSDVLVEAPIKAGVMTVIAADSQPVRSIDVSSLVIGVGEGYSVTIDTDDYAPNEAIKIPISLISHSHHAGRLRAHRGKAPMGLQDKFRLQDTQLYSRLSLPSNHLHDTSNSSRKMQIDFLNLTTSDPTSTTVRSSSISSFSSSSRKANDSMPSIDVRANKDILFLWRNDGTMNHPIHMHSHHLQILAASNWFYDPLTDTRVNRDFNVEAVPSLLSSRGVVRDTITVPAHSWVLTRTLAKQTHVNVHGAGSWAVGVLPGKWLLHCHTQWHEQSGMSILVTSS